TGMADKVYPTEFAGGWQNVLRHIKYPSTGPNGWGQATPRSEFLWLALEDIWVQRAMLDAVKSVNDQIGAFTRDVYLDTSGTKVENNLERAFTSRVWDLKLKAAPRPGDNRVVLSGSLRNRTDRLQLLGSGNTMVLNVWLSSAPSAQPIPFRIGGEFVAGGATLNIAPSEDHVLPAGTPVEELYKVEQVFDSRTVPIHRIERLALGYRDSRYAAFPMLMPLFPAFKKEAEAAAAPAEGTGQSGGMQGPGGPGGGSKMPGATGAGGAATNSGPTGQFEGGGDVAGVLDGNRKRYVEITQQVRRMPVAIVLVVDQAYIEDVLLAYANSQLRFQITQVHWQRFRGSLGGANSTSDYNSGGEQTSGPARGFEGQGIKIGGSGGLRPGGPGGPRGPMGPMGPMGGTPGGPGGPSGGLVGPGGAAPGGGSLTTISEGQLTAGLVEITVYGIVTLYEKFEEKTAK
ncbi:MAG TPA: hypothetical protein VGL71_03010, partial [Urbifossiella sp.]